MPTVDRIGAYRVTIYPADHRPAHVHVIGPEGEVVLNLNCPNGPIVERENYGLTASQVRRFKRYLEPKIPQLCSEWHAIHG